MGCGIAMLATVLCVLAAGGGLIYFLVTKVDQDARAQSGPDPSPGPKKGSLRELVQSRVGPFELDPKSLARDPDIPAELDSLSMLYQGNRIEIVHKLIAASSGFDAAQIVSGAAEAARQKAPADARMQDGPIRDKSGKQVGAMFHLTRAGRGVFVWHIDTLVGVAEGPADEVEAFLHALPYGVS